MAITILDVTSGSGNASSRQLSAFATNPATGDLIVVGVAMYSSGTINVPTDTAGNTYVRLGTTQLAAAASCYLGMFYAANIVGGASFKVTCSFNSAHDYATAAWAITGVSTTPYNGDWVTRNAATAPGSLVDAGTPASAPAANSIYVGLLSVNIAVVATDGTGWNTTGVNGFTSTMLTAAKVPDYSAHDDIFSSYKMSSAIASANWSIAPKTSDPWVAMQASFAPPVSAPATKLNTLLLAP